MVNTLDQIIDGIQGYVVAPLNAFGIGGFLFDVAGESVASLSADITDHYTEDNRALEDHIAIRPKKITLKGYVGELIYSPSGNGQSAVENMVKKLTTVSAYLPTLSAAAQQLSQSIASPADATLTLKAASNIYGLVQNLLGASGAQARQQNAYNYFKALLTEGILMGIQTPWEFMTNMAIEHITAIQPESSQSFSDFAVTFKQIRIAQTITTAYSSASTGGVTPSGGPTLQGAAALQATPQNQLGNVPGLLMNGTYVPGVSPPGAQGYMSGGGSIFTNPATKNIFQIPGA